MENKEMKAAEALATATEAISQTPVVSGGSTITEAELLQDEIDQFRSENPGKKATYKGKPTKTFLAWKEARKVPK